MVHEFMTMKCTSVFIFKQLSSNNLLQKRHRYNSFITIKTLTRIPLKQLYVVTHINPQLSIINHANIMIRKPHLIWPFKPIRAFLNIELCFENRYASTSSWDHLYVGTCFLVCSIVAQDLWYFCTAKKPVVASHKRGKRCRKGGRRNWWSLPVTLLKRCLVAL